MFCYKPECQKNKKEYYKSLQRKWKESKVTEKPPEPEKRKCRSLEMMGFRSKRCLGYINKGNRYFCSYCHAAATNIDGMEEHEIGWV